MQKIKQSDNEKGAPAGALEIIFDRISTRPPDVGSPDTSVGYVLVPLEIEVVAMRAVHKERNDYYPRKHKHEYMLRSQRVEIQIHLIVLQSSIALGPKVPRTERHGRRKGENPPVKSIASDSII
jgi:hypothetical protein